MGVVGSKSIVCFTSFLNQRKKLENRQDSPVDLKYMTFKIPGAFIVKLGLEQK